MEYESLNVADQLLLARDMLRARESDHFRISLLSEPNRESRLQAMEEEIQQIKAVVSSLENKASDEPAMDLEDPHVRAARTRKLNSETESA